MKYLEKHRVNARLRRSRGKDIDAACGQLANKSWTLNSSRCKRVTILHFTINIFVNICAKRHRQLQQIHTQKKNSAIKESIIRKEKGKERRQEAIEKSLLQRDCKRWPLLKQEGK